MNFFLLILIIISSVLVNANNHFEQKIAKISSPYEQAMKLLENKIPVANVENNAKFIFDFFNLTNLYTKRNIKKFKQSLAAIKKLSTRKNISSEQTIFANVLILKLENIQQFIIEHAGEHYAHKIYNQIESIYHDIETENVNILDELSFLNPKNNRALYHFVKKIHLDIRRLTALLSLENVTDTTIIKIDNLLKKISILKEKIMETPIYKQQLRKTRWLKACGIVFVPMALFVPLVVLVGCLSPLSLIITIPELIIVAPILGLLYASLIVSIVTTIQDVKEAEKYEIPVESRSIFSLVAWQGWVIFIGVRIPIFISAII